VQLLKKKLKKLPKKLLKKQQNNNWRFYIMAFTAKDVQALRERTGCGMMDCKKALVESDGDMDKAVDFLREKGLASQQKKASRIAAEGTVAIAVEGKVGAIVEVNAETDFVAGNEEFKAFANKLAGMVAEQNPADLEAFMSCKDENGATVEEQVQEIFLKFRENIKVRRFERLEGNIVSYSHGNGRIGVLVVFDTTDEIASKDAFTAMGRDVAMQITAINPSYLDKADVPADVLDREKEILVAQMKEDPKMANKPEKVLHNIVAGKLGKYYEENCLLQQAFVKENKMTVSQYIDGVAKELGGAISLKSFVRFERGEGLEKKVDNFAEEVASMAK
jgi:elongation factor Ts